MCYQWDKLSHCMDEIYQENQGYIYMAKNLFNKFIIGFYPNVSECPLYFGDFKVVRCVFVGKNAKGIYQEIIRRFRVDNFTVEEEHETFTIFSSDRHKPGDDLSSLMSLLSL